MAVVAIVQATPPLVPAADDVIATPETQIKKRKLQSSELQTCLQNPSVTSPNPVLVVNNTNQKPNKPQPHDINSRPEQNHDALANSNSEQSTIRTNPQTSQPLKTSTQPKPPPSPSQHPENHLRHTCEGCTDPHDGSYGSGRFCSVHCARRIAAGRKWEKQRTARKQRALAATTTTPTIPSGIEPSTTSSLSSTSSLDIRTLKRRRVVVAPSPQPTHAQPHQMHAVLPGASTPPPPLHGHATSHHAVQSNSHAFSHQASQVRSPQQAGIVHPQPQQAGIVHPQPQHFTRHHALPSEMHPFMGHVAPGRQPMSGPYVDYGRVPIRAVSPFHYATPGAYYPYHAHPIAYTPTPPPAQYAVFSSQPMAHPHPPPPPPPTPATEGLVGGMNGSFSGSGCDNVPGPDVYAFRANGSAPKAQVSTERECNAVAEALLCLRSSSRNE